MNLEDKRKNEYARETNFPSIPKLTRSDIEKMVNIEWQNNTHILIGEVFFEITFDKYEKRFFLSINDENYSFGTLKKARDFAKEWVVDFICSALGVEEYR